MDHQEHYLPLEPSDPLDVVGALRFLFRLIRLNRAYLVNVCGPREVEQGRAAAVQIVPGIYLGVEGAAGLPWLYDCDERGYPFDPRPLEPYWRAIGMQPPFLQGIDGPFHMIAMPLGSNIEAAAALVEAVMRHAYHYDLQTRYSCTIYDMGIMTPSNFPRRAPPGGCVA